MLKVFQRRNNLGIKIMMGVILGLISLMMVVTLVPGLVGSMNNSPDTVATVGSETISVADVSTMVDRQMRGGSLPPSLKGFYAKQVVDQLIFIKALTVEAQRLGITVTPQEQADRIRELLPSVFVDAKWVGKDKYVQEVEQRTGMSVPEFEEWIRESLIGEKFRHLVTDGITVSPDEVSQDFLRRNEKIKVDYVVLKPADFVQSINPSDQELTDYFNKNKARYSVPERRSARYAELTADQIQKRIKITDADMQAYYNQHINDYKVPERVHVEHILFKTVGKTDAEIAEIRLKAEDVLAKAKHGANFEGLAKEYSEDTSKDKGGDIGWIQRGQTVAEFEKTAFTLPNGSISDLVKTQYGFHIIKVVEHENARTQPLDEVRLNIIEALTNQESTDLMDKSEGDLASAIRQSNRQSLDDLAKRFGLTVGETPAVSAAEPLAALGNAPALRDELFALQQGEISSPIRTDKGYVVLQVKSIVPAHAPSLAEVRDRVLADYRQAKSIDLAQSKANQFTSLVRSGKSVQEAAKELGLDVKSSEPFSRTGSVPDIGSGKQIEAAFGMKVGQVSAAVPLTGNWVVYSVTEHDSVNPADLGAQRKEIEKQLLESKRSMAFEAFRQALEDRLKQEGKVVINADVMKRLTSTT
jgi:peptidyl-prolyl cis-trans isomerase D